MQNNNPLNKVVFIHKVAAFTKTNKSIQDLFRLAYVSNSWNDTIKNYSFHLFENELTRHGPEVAKILDRLCGSVIKRDVTWFVNVVLFSNTMMMGFNPLAIVCQYAKSLDMAQFAFAKIFEIGGTELLHSQLAAGNGRNCLAHACRKSSPEFVKFICEKIVEVGGNCLLTSQITATMDDGWNCAMGAGTSSSLKSSNFIFEKIVETGGRDMLQNQLASRDGSGETCLMHACQGYSSVEVTKLVFEKIDEAGGKDFLRDQITAMTSGTMGRTCLIFVCCNQKTPEVMKLVFEKIIEAGGVDLLRDQIAVNDHNRNCLTLASSHSSPDVAKYLAAVLFELGLFKDQHANLDDDAREKLRKESGIDDVSWVPDPDTNAEVQKMLKR